MDFLFITLLITLHSLFNTQGTYIPHTRIKIQKKHVKQQSTTRYITKMHVRRFLWISYFTTLSESATAEEHTHIRAYRIFLLSSYKYQMNVHSITTIHIYQYTIRWRCQSPKNANTPFHTAIVATVTILTKEWYGNRRGRMGILMEPYWTPLGVNRTLSVGLCVQSFDRFPPVLNEW